MSGFWNVYGDMPAIIDEVRELVSSNLRASHSRQVGQVVEHLLASEGKFLRAGLTVLSGRAGGCGQRQEELLHAAAAFEMLHMATLVHDDIIDDARMRRGAVSLQSRYGKDVAVYAGDYILARAFRFLAENRLEFLAPISRGIEQICQGEITQNMNRYRTDMTYRTCMRIIVGKTAALFAMCAWAGGEIAEMGTREKKCLTRAAKDIGCAFQIMDDCRDYDGAQEQLRKEPENDMKNGVYTLPLVLAVKNGEIPDFAAWADAGRTAELVRAVQQSAGLAQARQIARRYAEKGQRELGCLEQNEALKQLSQLFGQMIEA